MMETRYMHTLDGKPAGFDDRNEYIYFITGNVNASLFKSLAKIRRNEIISQKNNPTEASRYGYIRVNVEA